MNALVSSLGLRLVVPALAALLVSAPIGAIALDRTPYAPDTPAASAPLTEAPLLHPLDAKGSPEHRPLPGDADGERADGEDALSMARATQLPYGGAPLR